MLKYLFAFVMLIHGAIHFMGFAKAYGYGNMTQLTKEISKLVGIAWLLTALQFIIAVVLFLFKKDEWASVAVIAAVISQILILRTWKDAKFGTIVNVIVLLVAIPAIADWQFTEMIHKDITTVLSHSVTLKGFI